MAHKLQEGKHYDNQKLSKEEHEHILCVDHTFHFLGYELSTGTDIYNIDYHAWASGPQLQINRLDNFSLFMLYSNLNLRDRIFFETDF